jgi:hypothetical protein
LASAAETLPADAGSSPEMKRAAKNAVYVKVRITGEFHAEVEMAL